METAYNRILVEFDMLVDLDLAIFKYIIEKLTLIYFCNYVDKDKLKEEYADALIMTLSMFNYLDINLELVEHSKTSNILEIFNELFKDASNIMNKDTLSVKKVFSNLIYISTLLNITEEEIKDACYKKQEIVEKRLSDDNY